MHRHTLHTFSLQVGYDTAVRLLDPRYYGGTAHAVLDALLPLRLNGTVFLVAGRLESPSSGEGRFLAFDADLAPCVPAPLRGLFVGISETEFREDVSSSQIRAATHAKGTLA